MSKYSGLFLSFLLIFICLWINICRYPQVWKMVNGNETPASSEETDTEETLETSAPAYERSSSHIRFVTSDEGNWPKPVIISSNEPVPAMTADAEEPAAEDDGVYRNVSYTADQCAAESVANLAKSDESESADSGGEESGGAGEDGEEENEGVPEGVSVHSSYMAAEFHEESSPLDTEDPSYDIKQ